MAQSAAAQSMLEEIVVTARRREETLADLPLSVASISADAMQAQGIYNIDNLGDFIPNLTFTNTDRRHVKAIYIRGIGNDSPISIRPSGTGLYLDGQYLPNTMGQMMSTVDIERVEVLRGPQGTLFGKNTTGGAINIVTVKPTDEFEADVLMRVGDHGTMDFKGVLNIPFNDMIAGRFSVISEQMDGHFYNQTLGKNVGAIDVQGFGAAFRVTP
ncbi:TonB-dependent receptor, partial [Gammaproteobacteria bacterium]|nr:TonB-dependent receptor [Gammaproteobacteria bacterium]